MICMRDDMDKHVHNSSTMFLLFSNTIGEMHAVCEGFAICKSLSLMCSGSY